MARNAEKAQSTLYKWHASQAKDMGLITGGSRRPRAVQSVDALPVAERWRGAVLQDISRKHSKIQDASLSDPQVRDVNDQLNKLFGEKRAWERRIMELGGPRYGRGPGGADGMGRELKGYRYFGRAMELPGVKEAFEAREARDREEREGARGGADNALRGKIVDAGYYGWNNDEADGSLLAYEADVDRKTRERQLAQKDADGEGDQGWEELPGDAGDGKRWILPTQEDVQEELLERRRRALLDKLGG